MTEAVDTPDATLPAPTPPAPGRPTRDAIIFVPGIGSAFANQTLDGVSQRIAHALDMDAISGHSRFSVSASEENVGSDAVRVCTISRELNGVTDALVDVYGVDYARTLTRPYRDTPLLYRGWLTLLMLVANFPPFAKALFVGRGKDLRQRVQFLFAAGVLLLLATYVALVTVTVVGLIVRHWQPDAEVSTASRTDPAGGTTRPATGPVTVDADADEGFSLLDWFKTLVVAMAAAGLIVRWDWREGVTRATIQYLAVIDYLRYGQRTADAVGTLQGVLGQIADRTDVSYRRVIVVAYSFGAVVTLDTLFPVHGPPVERTRQITDLITIGNPFDIIRTFFAGSYPLERPQPAHPRRWLNVYSPIDVFASDFKDVTSKPAGKEEGLHVRNSVSGSKTLIRPDENVAYNIAGRTTLKVGDILRMLGLRAHYGYWGREEVGEANCFGPIVRWLYAGHEHLK